MAALQAVQAVQPVQPVQQVQKVQGMQPVQPVTEEEDGETGGRWDDAYAALAGLRLTDACRPDEPEVLADSSKQTCPFCAAAAAAGSPAAPLRVLDGNWTCTACSSVVARLLDHGAEWRTFFGGDDGGGSDIARCGPPVSDLLPSLGSRLAGAFTGKESHAVRMLQRYQAWGSRTYRERTLCGVFDKLSVNAISNGIPHCILEDSKAMYKRLSDARVSRGESRGALVAAALYMSCKTNGVPRSVKEVAEMFGVHPSALTKSLKVAQTVTKVSVQGSAPTDFVGRFCSRLSVADGPAALVRRVVRLSEELYIATDSTPPSLVAGALELVNGELGLGMGKRAIAEACHVAPVTVAKCLKSLQARRADLLPDTAAGVAAYAAPRVRACGR
jgi:transcription initiation factor TFIIB